ncbi:hypothetical protein ABFT23_01985 [Nocardioides sp. C4-1]|uniref:tetratricopeptide repeat protein n=1 Tax=Nocardioides sp. C4-1 TaxID=3151851 RepID=UPI0032638178
MSDEVVNHLALARAYLMAGRLDEAESHARQVATVAEQQARPLAVASLLLARASIARGNTEAARRQLDDAATGLQAVLQDRWAARIWCEIAEAHDEIGSATAARVAYRQAGTASGLAVPTMPDPVGSTAPR